LNYKQIHFTQFMYKFISRFQFSVDVDLLFGWLKAFRFGLALGLELLPPLLWLSTEMLTSSQQTHSHTLAHTCPDASVWG